MAEMMDYERKLRSVKKFARKTGAPLKMTKKDKVQDKQIARLKRRVKAISPEPMYWDVQQALTEITTGVQVWALSNLNGVGDADGNRTGDSIKITSVSVRGVILGTLNSAASDEYNKVCVMLVMDTNSQGTIFGGGSLLASTGNSFTPIEHINYTNRRRFKVLYRRNITLTPGTDSTLQPYAASPFKLDFEIFKRFKRPISATYLNGGGTSTALGQNHLFLVACSDSGVANSPTIEWKSRVKYHE